MEHATLFLVLACAFGFFMAWGIGANDVANAMGTSVGSKALTIKQAIIVAAIFEAAGALLAGGGVTDTMRSGIIDLSAFTEDPQSLIVGMLAALLATASWLLIASFFGWPVSTTHTIVGAISGFGVITIGIHAVQWQTMLNIMLSWVLTPLIAGTLAYLLFRSVQRLIFNTKSPLANAKRTIPYYIFLVAFVISLVTVSKGLKYIGLDLNLTAMLGASIAFSALCTLTGVIALHRIKISPDDAPYDFTQVERAFGYLMVFTACSLAFAHGSNDVANAIGPIAMVIDIIHNGAHLAITQSIAVPLWILALGAVGIVTGLATYGYRVIATIGQGITELTPSRGFAAELAAACTIVIASSLGLPISTTQTLVGAVLGVGFAHGISALRLNVIGKIFMSWIITIPAGAVLAILYFYLLKLLLS